MDNNMSIASRGVEHRAPSGQEWNVTGQEQSGGEDRKAKNSAPHPKWIVSFLEPIDK
jgi:hypothetical protein